jgi:hypothetical protein
MASSLPTTGKAGVVKAKDDAGLTDRLVRNSPPFSCPSPPPFLPSVRLSLRLRPGRLFAAPSRFQC